MIKNIHLNRDIVQLIIDIIRPDYFKAIFKNIEIIDSFQNTIHKSKIVIRGNFSL